jgi:hypothetical protein
MKAKRQDKTRRSCGVRLTECPFLLSGEVDCSGAAEILSLDQSFIDVLAETMSLIEKGI